MNAELLMAGAPCSNVASVVANAQQGGAERNAAMEKAAVALRKWFAYLISKTLMGDGTPYAVCGAPVITEHGMLASGRLSNEDEMYGTHAFWLAHPCRCRLMGYIYLE